VIREAVRLFEPDAVYCTDGFPTPCPLDCLNVSAC
jgi:hypothetical protein